MSGAIRQTYSTHNIVPSLYLTPELSKYWPLYFKFRPVDDEEDVTEGDPDILEDGEVVYADSDCDCDDDGDIFDSVD